MKRGATLVELLVVVTFFAVLGLILLPPGVPSPYRGENARRAVCQSNLKRVGQALLQYAQDHDEGFPLTSIRPVWPAKRADGWSATLLPYTKPTSLFHCPSVDIVRENNPRRAGFTDYFLNSNIAAKSLEKIDEPASTIVLAEGNDGRDESDARYNYSSVPAAWLKDEKSPAYRHLGVANYAFVDGHVKALKPDELRSGRYFFSLKRGR